MELPEIVPTNKLIELSTSGSGNKLNDEKELEKLKELNEKKRLEKFEKFAQLSSKKKTINDKNFSSKKRFSLPMHNDPQDKEGKISDNDLYVKLMLAIGVIVTNKDMEKWEFKKRKKWEIDMKILREHMEKLARYHEDEESEDTNSNDSTDTDKPSSIYATERSLMTHTAPTVHTSPILSRNSQKEDIKKPKQHTKSLGIMKTKKSNYFEQSLNEIYEAEKSYPHYDESVPQLLMRVPLIMVRLIKLIEINGGLEQEGIFRLSPSILIIEKFKAKIMKKAEKKTIKKFNNLKCDDPHLAASILKQWFIGLIEPLFPNYNACISSLENDKVLDVARALPTIHERTFFYLLKFLKTVAESDKNKMNLNALALVWAPALLKCPHIDVDYQLAAKNTILEGKFISTLFEKHPNHLLGFGAIGSDVKIFSKKIPATIINYRTSDGLYNVEYEEDKEKKSSWIPEKDISWQTSSSTVERDVYLSKYLEDN